MIIRCKITKNVRFGGIFFIKSLNPSKKLLSSMLLSRVGRKSETDRFFFRPNTKRSLMSFNKFNCQLDSVGDYM